MTFVLSAISLVVTLGAAAVILWRMLALSGVDLRNPFQNAYSGHTAGFKKCLYVFLLALAFRVFILLAVFLFRCIALDSGASTPWNTFFSSWVKWDANNYLRIADGYGSYQIDGDYSTLVFFPLYSWLIRLFSLVIPDRMITGLIVSFLAYAGGCAVLYALISRDYSVKTAQTTVTLLSVFPFSFFFGGLMSESVFLLTSVLTLYFARRQQWLFAGVAGFFAALSRSAGVFLIIPLTAEYLENCRFFLLPSKKKLPALVSWLWLLLLPLGTCVYLFINYRVAGNPLEFLRLEEKYWYQTGSLFYQNVGNFWTILTGNYGVSVKASAFLPGLLFLLMMYGLLLGGLKKHRTIYTLWLLVYLIVNTSMSWPLSLGRYLSCAVPAFVILAEAVQKRSWLEKGVTVAFAVLMAFYIVGFMSNKQIM